MGRNWGLPCEFLSYEKKPFTFEEALGLALLHDVPVRPYVRGHKLPVMSRIWSAWEQFDVESAAWFPYWRGEGPLAADNPDVLISAHVNERGVLAVVMNAGEDEAVFSLTIDTHRAGLPAAGLEVRDVISDETLAATGDTLRLTLAPLHMRMLLISAR